jgi:hypothetical protein
MMQHRFTRTRTGTWLVRVLSGVATAGVFLAVPLFAVSAFAPRSESAEATPVLVPIVPDDELVACGLKTPQASDAKPPQVAVGGETPSTVLLRKWVYTSQPKRSGQP